MERLKAFRIFFSLAALLFVAKPFFGFGAFNQQTRPRIAHTVLVKSFTKRKPESLEDAEVNQKRIHQQLVNPIIALFSSISVLLLALFPSLFNHLLKITGKTVADIRLALLPTVNAYLFTGSLII